MIGPFQLDVAAEVLLRDGAPLPVGRRGVALLLMLLRRAGEVVTKDELIAGVWAGQIVEESNLTSQIAALRRVFARDPLSAGWIETLSRRGYRFTGPVAWEAEAATRSVPAPAINRGRFDDGRPSLAVLPFRVANPETVPTYIADGLVEDIVSALAALPELTVISRGSTLRYRDGEQTLSEIGAALNVRYLVTGSMRRSIDRLRVTVETAEAATGGILSSRGHDGAWGEMFDAQDQTVAQIVRSIAPRVRDEELRRVRMKRPESLQAYDIVLQAREQIYRLDRESFALSEDLLSRAIALDPHYAAARALMAEFLSLRYGQGWSSDPEKDGAAVMRFARDAIGLDPNDPRALACLAHNRAFFGRDTNAALPLFERALDVSPSNASAWMWSSVTYSYIGDGPEAVRRGELALRLSPRDWFGFQFSTALCLAHYTVGHFESAVRYGLDALSENPRYHSALRYTIASLVACSDLSRARAVAVDLLTLEPQFRVGPVIASHPFQASERRKEYGQRLCAAGLPP